MSTYLEYLEPCDETVGPPRLSCEYKGTSTDTVYDVAIDAITPGMSPAKVGSVDGTASGVAYIIVDIAWFVS